MRYDVIVESGRDNPEDYRNALWKMGIYLRDDEQYKGSVSKRQYEKVKEFCRFHGLSFRSDNDFGKRDAFYRRRFFESSRPGFFGMYFCAYCGVPHKKITVDHLWPVAKVQKSLRLQKRLRHIGIRGINDRRNLVPACMSCNKRKSAKLGFWQMWGRLGSVQWLWYPRWAARIYFLFCVVYYGVASNDAIYLENLRTSFVMALDSFRLFLLSFGLPRISSFFPFAAQ